MAGDRTPRGDGRDPPSRRALLRGFAAAAVVAAALGLPAGRSAWALELEQAKAQGLVGERRDGYVGQVSGGDEVAALVERINTERRQAYERVAAENGIPLNQVERLAAEKLISRAAPGTFVMDASGRWFRK